MSSFRGSRSSNIRAGIASLAVAAIAGLAPAVTAAPAFAGQPARAGAASQALSQSASPTRLWLTRQEVKQGGANYSVAASPDGSAVFTAGELNKANDVPTAVIDAYNAATGSELWNVKYTTAAKSVFVSLAVSPDGSTVFASGYSQATGKSQRNYVTVAFSAATGAMLWQAGTVIPGIIAAMAVAADGSAVFVTGPGGTAAYNAATGATLWTAPAIAGVSIAVAPDGSAVYLASTQAIGANDGYLTTAESAATGATLWTAAFNVAHGSSSAASVAADPDGSAVFITGTTHDSATSETRITTVAYDPTAGTRLWVRSTNSAVNVPASARMVTVSPDGSAVYVTGSYGGSVNPVYDGEYLTVAYGAATGAVRWTARYRGPATGPGSTPQDITVSPSGAEVFVTGDSWSAGTSSQPQFATVAYDASTGAVRWVARYGDVAAGASYGTAVAVSPDSSKVYVTGDTLPYGTTIAYSG